MRMSDYCLRLPVVCMLACAVAGCNKSDDDDQMLPEPDVVTTLDITVSGSDVQAPAGNVYLFYSEDTNLDLATGEGDGTLAPLVDVGTPFSPVVHYVKGGQRTTIHPVSSYGSKSAGILDNYSSVRYRQVHFDITKLSAEYGQVKKGCAVLVVIVLNDPQSQSWVAHPLQLRRNYLIHVSLPDYLKQTYVTGSELNAKWWQVEE